MLDKYDVSISDITPYAWQSKENTTIFDMTVKISIKTDGGKYVGYDIDNISNLSSIFSDLVNISEVAIETINTKYNFKTAFDFFKNEGEDEMYFFMIDFKYNIDK